MPSDDAPIALSISARSPLTEISVTDAKYRPVDLEQNAGRASVDLPPGVYTVRFLEGDRVEEQSAMLLPGGSPVRVDQAAGVHFESAAPLEGTATTREVHQAPAVELSGGDAHIREGTGASVTVMVRDPGTGHRTGGTLVGERVPPDVAQRLSLEKADTRVRPADDRGPVDPTVGLSLQRLDGSEIAPVGAGMSRPDDRVGGIKAELAPGSYRLRLDSGTGRLFEMPIVATAGWQTLVFLLTRRYAKGLPQQRADFDTMSVSMVPEGSAFDPASPDSRLTELALRALAGARRLRGGELKDILWGKYRDPMLGVYGAHLLLMQDDPDLDFVDTVISNTDGLIPDHPDVAGLAAAAALRGGGRGRDVAIFRTPPMLAAGWRAVVAASRVDPDVVPPGSLSDLVSDRTVDTGPWMVWADPPELDEHPPTAASDDPAMSEPGAAVARLRATLADEDARRWAAQAESLDPAQRVLVTAVDPDSDPLVRRVLGKAGTLADVEVSDDVLSRDLNVPVSSVRRLASELDDVLKRRET